jgi:wyosine [tRNA(Phe)-imidazoG37] synthetase (radical SAM superfamily)
MRIFGPVPSRRLGYSLGVDPVPFKTCTLDCLYCQLGPTPVKTVERKEYVPAAEIIAELEKKLEEGGRIDWITLSGSGEPTLYSKIGEIIRAAKRMTEIPVAVLTNGTLLGDPRVRDDLMAADLVIPSLDAGSEETFRRVNRPLPSLSFADVVKGMEEFSKSFTGRVWLEVMLVRGINDSREELELMASLIQKIKPEKVQLNSVERPPAFEEAKAMSEGEMREARRLLEGLLPGIEVETVMEFREETRSAGQHNIEKTVLEYLRRRPATVGDLAMTLGLHRTEVIKYLQHLRTAGSVEMKELGGKDYFIYREKNAAD